MLGQLALQGVDGAPRERPVGGDQDAERERIMLSLRDQIGSDLPRVGAGVGDDDDLGRSGE